MIERRTIDSRAEWLTAARCRFERLFIPEPNTGCWLWLGANGSQGYGNFSMQGRTTRASRASWMLYRGQIPAGRLICHSCDVPSCVNPDHLWLGTPQDNSRDCAAKGRFNPRKGQTNSAAKLNETLIRFIMTDPRSVRQIACEIGISPTVIHAVRSGKRWTHITNGVKTTRSRMGESNHKAKLTARQIIAIRKDERSGPAVAREYGVSNQVIWRIRTRRIWRHVD